MFKGKIIIRLALLGVLLSGLGFAMNSAEKVSAKDFCRACVPGPIKGIWHYCTWNTHGTACALPVPPDADCTPDPYCVPY